ncbi:hypothetical protein LCGC14_1476630 [marine sediment metagenome]|uniref:Uncharacterized protein n=1 Tax=marine sediment metagenome TaxID=412755 RepID=A0A0F9JBI4_9ZZZZ
MRAGTITGKVWKTIKKYAKRHIFHMIMIVVFAILTVSHITQYTIVGSVYGLTALNKIALNSYRQEVSDDREIDKESVYDTIKDQETKFYLIAFIAFEEEWIELKKEAEDVINSAQLIE